MQYAITNPGWYKQWTGKCAAALLFAPLNGRKPSQRAGIELDEPFT